MCGRTCLTLDSKEIQCCCKYRKTSQKKPLPPEYRNEFNCGRKYFPSYNIAPTDLSPVLVSAAHFNEDTDTSERIIVPMMWSMIPRWHKGDYRKHGLTTNNCRLENLAMSKLYGFPLHSGYRCVILCEGFYEWQTTKELKASERPAFFIHMPQNENVKMYDKSTWNFNEGGITLLKMAGLFDIWEDENGDKLYSYTVITLESNRKFSEIHHRIPAILETEEEISQWLDFRRIGVNRALNLLKPSESIQWYSVSNIENNSRNKSDQCNKPSKDINFSKNNLMRNWLLIKKRSNENFDVDEGSSSETKIKKI
ncbi:abasic site processing protein HMCES [Malaya genurostris]|uniref:abasic site processing protein HMCES n=1 Tax=Malaya genurostris TaxID=325434 RepID=UPI0026F3DC64|nr:abasic site processing protein HMCES [Malaya genurostris]